MTLLFAVLAALALGAVIGGSFSYASLVEQEVRKHMQAGPLGGMTKKALQVQRSMAALRGRVFAASVIHRRLEELKASIDCDPHYDYAASAAVALELASLMVAISSLESPAEDMNITELPTVEECQYRGAVGQKTTDELEKMAEKL